MVKEFNQGENEENIQAGDQPDQNEGFQEEYSQPTYQMGDSDKRKKQLFLVAILVLGGALIFFMFSGGDKKTPPAPVKTTEETQIERQPVLIPPPPPRIEIQPPKLTESTVPPPPIPPRSPESIRGTSTAPEVVAEKPVKKITEKELARMKSNILIGGGGTGGALIGGVQGKDIYYSSLDKTKAKTVEITRTSNPSSTIFQGKIMDAVLETAINTELPGVLRAILSHDVYSESGKNILFPKGSRLIGEYGSQVKRGQARIFIVWKRVIKPDGTDVNFDNTSVGVDSLGRSGIKGDVDNRFMEILSSSVLLSAINIAFAKATEEMTDAQGVTQGETGSGDTTTTGKASDIATLNAVQSFGSTTQSLVSGLLNTTPVITLDQGTKVKVFVNQDIIFPEGATSNFTFIN